MINSNTFLILTALICTTQAFSFSASASRTTTAFTPQINNGRRLMNPPSLSSPLSSTSRAWAKETPLYSTDGNSDSDSDSDSDGSGDEIKAEKVEEEEEVAPTPISDALQMQSKAFTTEPEIQERMDPLIASLTRMDADTANAPTTKLPLLGEVPIDGSLVVLVPVTIIAIVGFVMSINIALNSKDVFMEKLNEVGTVMSAPPVKETKIIDPAACRGLCSSQDEQLDTMRVFMNKLAKKEEVAAVQVETAPAAAVVEVVEEVAPAPAPVVEEAAPAPAPVPVAVTEEVPPVAVTEEAAPAPVTIAE